MLKGRNKENDSMSAEGLTGVVDMIAAGTVIEGSLNSIKGIRIDGTVKGSVTTEGKLVVGKSGIIEGEIICGNADIEGELKSTIQVKGLLQLKSTANLLGDIVTSKLRIEEGAHFSGNCKMGAVVKDISKKDTNKNAKVAETA